MQVFATSGSCTEHHLNSCSSQNPGKSRIFSNSPSMMLLYFQVFVHQTVVTDFSCLAFLRSTVICMSSFLFSFLFPLDYHCLGPFVTFNLLVAFIINSSLNVLVMLALATVMFFILRFTEKSLSVACFINN